MDNRTEKIQKISLIILSILLAFFLWLYVMGDKNPIQTKELRNVKVVLTNIDSISQANLALLPNQSFNMDLMLTGRTFDLSKVDSGDVKLEADMNVALRKGVNTIPVKILNSQSRISVATKNKATYIAVKLDDLAEKKIPVDINVIGKVKDGYGYTKAIIRPHEVSVSGPATYVEAVDSASGSIFISDNHTLISGSIKLASFDKNGVNVNNVNISPAYVDATVAIKPCKEVPIKINTIGTLPNGKLLKNIRSQIDRIDIMGDNKYLNRISEIEAGTIDLSKISGSTVVRVPINLPMGVTSVDDINTVKVYVTLENKIVKSFNCGLSIKNKSNDYDYNLSSDFVTVSLSGPENVINALTNDSVKPYVDAAGLGEVTQTLPVSIDAIEGVDIKTITPSDIQVIVTKKNG